MKNVMRLAQLTFVSGFALISAGLPSLAASAGNLDSRLRGSYAFTTTRTCTTSPAPFVGPTFALPNVNPSLIGRIISSDSGILTFNGDGTGTSIGRATAMVITSTVGSPLSVSDFNNTVNYTVNPDGTVDTASSGTFEFAFGSLVGTSGTSTGTVGRLQVANGNQMLVSAPTEQVSPETLVSTPPLNGYPNGQFRLCVRSTTATKLPGK